MNKSILIIFASICFVLSTSALVFSKAKSGNTPRSIEKKRTVAVEKNKSVHSTKKQGMKRGQKTVSQKDRRNSRTAKITRNAPAVLEKVETDGEFVEYRVERGDTFEKVALKFGVEKNDIFESNSNLSQSLLPGGVLLIPRAGESLTGEDVVDFSARTPKPWKSEKEKYMFVKVARSFMGTPYRYGGESVRGLDGSAFVKKVYSIFDVQLPRFARDQYKTGPKISREELRVGDLVFFKTKRYAEYPTHVGIYIGDGNFIHSSPGQAANGVKIESLKTDFYARSYIGATRVKTSSDEATPDTPPQHNLWLFHLNPSS